VYYLPAIKGGEAQEKRGFFFLGFVFFDYFFFVLLLPLYASPLYGDLGLTPSLDMLVSPTQALRCKIIQILSPRWT